MKICTFTGRKWILPERAEAVLDEFHKANPLKEGMGIEELRSRMKLADGKLADDILAVLKTEK